MVTCEVETSALEARLREVRAQMAPARAVGVRELGGLWIDEMERRAPRDTHRYVAGWVQAGNEAGLAPRPVPRVRPSPRQRAFLEALERQLEHWIERRERVAEWMRLMEGADRSDLARGRRLKRPRVRSKKYREWRRQHLRAEERIAHASQQLRRAQIAAGTEEGFLIFDEGQFGLEARGRGRFNSYTRPGGAYLKSGARRRTSVRTRVYGGTGSVLTVRRTEGAGGGAFEVVELKNLEPHARIVERLPRFGHPVRTCNAVLRATGLRSVSKAYLDRIRIGRDLEAFAARRGG